MAAIKLKVDEFYKITRGLTDIEIASKMKVSTTQLWRVRLPDDDPRHNNPGKDFVAGVLTAFPDVRFEDLFYLE